MNTEPKNSSISTPIENRVLEEHIGAIEDLATGKLQLDFFPMIYELVPEDFMLELCTYGLPTRFNHWSFGISYKHQRFYGDMGFAKVYEIVLNNNPCMAFLLETNPLLPNLLVVAHVLGHSHFFKNNIAFRNTDRNMVMHANHHANRIDDYVQKYGAKTVENLLDIAFALDNHIDYYKGIYRKKYPARQIVEKDIYKDPYEDILHHQKDAGSFSKVRQVINEQIPPRPEKDILWFLSQYADLEDWQRDILDIVRKESHYFYPQFMTKILNEGFASLCHAELMREYLLPKDHLDFAKLHSSVVSPGHPLKMNPYYIGFKILEDIRSRWDKMFEGTYVDKEGKKITSTMNGWQKVLQVVKEEDDISFLRNYLTEELADDLGLFVYGFACDHKVGSGKYCDKCGTMVIQDRKLDNIVNQIILPKVNYGVPIVVINKVINETGEMELHHLDADSRGPLENRYAEETLLYIFRLWKKKVTLMTKDENGQGIKYICDNGKVEKALMIEPIEINLDDLLSSNDAWKLVMP